MFSKLDVKILVIVDEINWTRNNWHDFSKGQHRELLAFDDDLVDSLQRLTLRIALGLK